MSKQAFHINDCFNCDFAEVVYLLLCKRCDKQYVGSTTTTFHMCFNIHKSSLRTFGKGQRRIPGEQLYVHFCVEFKVGVNDSIFSGNDQQNV